MKKGIFNTFFILFAILLLQPDSSYAQSASNQNTGQDEVIELGTTEIKVKVETPQVKLYSSRIKPEFDDIHLEKSFKKEITGLGESFELKNGLSADATKRIEINKVLTKLR